MRKESISAFLLVMVAFAIFVQNAVAEPMMVEEVHEAPAEELVGGDMDEHGCIATAGYIWSEEKQVCVRPWEEDIEANVVIEHDASNGERNIVPKPINTASDGTNMETGDVEEEDYDHSQLIGIAAPTKSETAIVQDMQSNGTKNTPVTAPTANPMPIQTLNWFKQLLQALFSWVF